MPKALTKSSCWDQISLVDADIFHIKSIAESIAELEIVNFDDNINLIAIFFTIIVDEGKMKKKKDEKTNKKNVTKGANIFNKIIDYIYVTQYKRLFLLA